MVAVPSLMPVTLQVVLLGERETALLRVLQVAFLKTELAGTSTLSVTDSPILIVSALTIIVSINTVRRSNVFFMFLDLLWFIIRYFNGKDNGYVSINQIINVKQSIMKKIKNKKCYICKNVMWSLHLAKHLFSSNYHEIIIKLLCFFL